MTHAKTISTVLLLALLASCGDGDATLLYIKVLAREGVSPPVALAVTFTHGGLAEAPRLVRGPGGGAVSLPASLVIRADGLTGSARVQLAALDKPIFTADNVVARGEGKATLAADGRVDVTVVLAPSDSLIKQKIAPDTNYGASPRVAGDGQGNTVVVWEDSTTTSTQTLHDVWFRLYNRQGATTYKGAFLMTKEHQPTVAMQQAGTARGNFVVAWVRQNASSSGRGTIYGRSMTAKGQPDASPGAGTPAPLSDFAYASKPDIVARQPSGYAVVWQEEDLTGGQIRVMGRILDDHGRAMISPNGQMAPFKIASFLKSAGTPAPVVAADKFGGILVVWNEAGIIKGSAFSKVGGSLKLVRGAFTVAKTPSGKGSQPHATDLTYGYGVIWSDQSNFAPDTNGQCIRFRRFTVDGTPLAADFTLNTTTAQDQTNPRIARRWRDGSLLATWTSKASTTADPQGGINARALLHNGLPVGPDFVINTSTNGQQQAPAVCPHHNDGFAVVFTDGAGNTPALRSRLVFPDYIGTGQIGGLCEGQNQCTGQNLYCQSTQAGMRCLGSCKGGSEAACLHGGKCYTNKALSASYCTYPTNL